MHDTLNNSGILLVDKSAEWTSHDVVAKIRTFLPRGTKVGHTGTLDPFATGLLIILVGKKYTKQSEQFLKLDKTYEVRIQWCATSTTHDPEGEITQISDCVCPSVKRVKAILPTFTGKIQQIPPMYSAIKMGGKKLYTLARKGKTVERKPRSVNIHEIRIISHNTAKKQTVLHIHCSSGTYIRALARDLGKALGCMGYAQQLRRTTVGLYSVCNAYTIEILKEQNIHDFLLK